MLLTGKTGVLLGVANKRSIAFACAKAASEQGAKLILTCQNERLEESTRKLADALPGEAQVVICDVSKDESLDAATEVIAGLAPQLDFAVHSVAFANREELEGAFSQTTRQGWQTALDVSAYSLTAVAKRMAPLMTEGGSLVTMSYLGAQRVMPHYNVMGPAKAALEASVRYLAHDYGPQGVRVNAVSAGPIRTLAASGIAGFSQILDIAKERSPLRRNTTAEEVGDATLFLLSDLSRGITGTTLWVDSGYHTMGL